jgi:phytoene dehydrogenase-like protein
LKVVVLEKNEKCGGLVNSFIKDGFLFDGGVRALESAGIILPMLRDLEIDLEVAPSPVSIGIEKNIIHVTSKDSLKDYENLLKKTYPNNSDEIENVISVIKKIMKDMEVLYGVDNPLFNDFRSNRSYFIKSYIPWFFKFIFTLRRINRMRVPVEEFLKKIVANRSLLDIIGQHFFENTPAFFAMSYFYLYQDYFYPKGGVGKLAEAVQNKILGFGGVIKTEAEVKEVLADKNILKDARGNLYKYDMLVWAADLKTLYSITSTAGLSREVSNKIEIDKKNLLPKHGADSVFIMFLAVDESPEIYKAISHSHFFYTPSKQGLAETHRAELKKLLKNWSEISKEELFNWLDKFYKFNTYEISIPALKEPGAAPNGKTGMIVSTLFDYTLIKKVSESGWYEEFKEEAERRVIEILSNSIYPMLEEKVIFKFSATPLTIEKTVGSSEGSIVGWSFAESIPVTSSMLRINDASKTTIPNILKAGQWAYSPSGVPTSILTGKLAADVIIQKKKSSLQKFVL